MKRHPSLCWQQGPRDERGTASNYAGMAYCTKRKGHTGPHGWAKWVDGTVPEFARDPRDPRLIKRVMTRLRTEI